MSIFVDILVEWTNTVFVNSTNITTNIGTAAMSMANSIIKKVHLTIKAKSVTNSKVGLPS